MLWDNYWEKRKGKEIWTKFQCGLRLVPRDTSSLLDVGGGNGYFIELLRRNNINAEFGVADISKRAIEECRKRKIDAVLCDFERSSLPFKDDSFDVVTSLDTLEHMRNPWALLEEMKRVTGRYLIIVTPNFAFYQNRIDVMLGRPPRYMADRFGNCKHGGHFQFITFYTLINQLRKVGMEIEEYACVDTLFGKRIPGIKIIRKKFYNLVNDSVCIRARK